MKSDNAGPRDPAYLIKEWPWSRINSFLKSKIFTSEGGEKYFIPCEGVEEENLVAADNHPEWLDAIHAHGKLLNQHLYGFGVSDWRYPHRYWSEETVLRFIKLRARDGKPTGLCELPIPVRKGVAKSKYNYGELCRKAGFDYITQYERRENIVTDVMSTLRSFGMTGIKRIKSNVLELDNGESVYVSIAKRREAGKTQYNLPKSRPDNLRCFVFVQCDERGYVLHWHVIPSSAINEDATRINGPTDSCFTGLEQWWGLYEDRWSFITDAE